MVEEELTNFLASCGLSVKKANRDPDTMKARARVLASIIILSERRVRSENVEKLTRKVTRDAIPASVMAYVGSMPTLRNLESLISTAENRSVGSTGS